MSTARGESGCRDAGDVPDANAEVARQRARAAGRYARLRVPTDVYILDVGAGSCVVIDHPSGRRTMIDINDGRRLRTYEREELLRRPGGYLLALLEEAQLPDPIGWFKSRFGDYLYRFILSHPDADHLAGLRRLLAGELTLENFWDLPHSRTAATSGSTADARDWHAYQRYRSGGMISLTKRLSPLAGARGMSWSDDGIEILAPTRLDALLDGLLGRYNDMSYVVRVWHAGRSILLPGDIEEPGWRRLVERGVDLRADVLVASHHGRRSGYFEAAAQAISPTFVVVSTGQLAAAEDAHRLYRGARPPRQLLFDAVARNDLHPLPRHGLARDRSRAASSNKVVREAVARSPRRPAPAGAAVAGGRGARTASHPAPEAAAALASVVPSELLCGLQLPTPATRRMFGSQLRGRYRVAVASQ